MPMNAPECAGSEHGEAAATRTPKPRKNTGVQEQASKKASEVPLEQVVRMCVYVCVCRRVSACIRLACVIRIM